MITNVHADNAVALVYVCGFALDEGEAVAAALALTGDTVDLTPIVDIRPYPGAAGTLRRGHARGELGGHVLAEHVAEEPADLTGRCEGGAYGARHGHGRRRGA
ncbi:hypothetical protein CWIS_12645 [Cellulomonas sp. A375-1]|uniref:Uncharacterized protein n=1 Tax=Cellulomonas gelida TaxID=1712 RepID=A0A4Y3KSY6_9CELL|nr:MULTISPECIES: hypothetical protein [Cellulomonas]KMM45090.1 hypothetical protein CWIS_12645 [Cellulomonas sp. A375-1]GEA86040.1 hypothetical protein CGE01nite_32910 [Cellulomonas gelida]GGL33744.1 hypothetical protein GCM10009774_25330 [Cellulomonas gelida]